MTEQKQYFTEEEMKERLIEILEYYSHDDIVDFGDLHHEVFNNDYYIVYTNEAEKALTQYGLFNALHEIQNYENDHFGKVLTDISSPCDVAQSLWNIHSYQYMDDLDLYQYETVGEMLEALQDDEQ